MKQNLATSDQMIDRTGVAAKYLQYIVTVFALVVVLYVRVRLLSVPLERDEGEFAYMGQLLLKGISPFSNAYTMKLPGASIMYVLFMSLSGQTPAGIHTGLMLVNVACIALVYLLAKRIFDRNTAMFSCASYAVLSLDSSVAGIFAHATHFVVLFALAGFLLLHYAGTNRRLALLFLAGLCFGVAFTMKQHAALLLLFALLYLGWRSWRGAIFDGKQLITGNIFFLSGAIIPYALIVLWMVKAGSFADFWFWTVQYAREYTHAQPLSEGWNNFTATFAPLVTSQFPFWLLAGGGCLLVGLKKNYCTDKLFVFGFLVFSFLAVCPGLYFRTHYFVLLMPIVALLASAGAGAVGTLLSSRIPERVSRLVPVCLLLVAVTYSLYYGRENFFLNTPLAVSRAMNGTNPFPEALRIAAYIKNNTAPNEKVVVFGSEPEIYFYADRLAATGHIYMYGLMENQPYAERMQVQMIREIEATRPKYFVVVNVSVSWLAQEASIKLILDWAEQYLRNQYDQVGIIDIIDQKPTYYLWGDKAAGYSPVSGAYVIVYKRKSGI